MCIDVYTCKHVWTRAFVCACVFVYMQTHPEMANTKKLVMYLHICISINVFVYMKGVPLSQSTTEPEPPTEEENSTFFFVVDQKKKKIQKNRKRRKKEEMFKTMALKTFKE